MCSHYLYVLLQHSCFLALHECVKIPIYFFIMSLCCTQVSHFLTQHQYVKVPSSHWYPSFDTFASQNHTHLSVHIPLPIHFSHFYFPLKIILIFFHPHTSLNSYDIFQSLTASISKPLLHLDQSKSIAHILHFASISTLSTIRIVPVYLI